MAGVAVVLVALLAGQAGYVLWNTTLAPAAAFDASTHRMSEILFSPHFLYVFEATSILILAALVGAVALAKKDA
jgi:NADH:ubiquinone oxidoreductase subunit 6 (subunit J)